MNADTHQVIQTQGGPGGAAQPTLHTPGINPPVHLKTIRRKPGIEAIAHIAIFRAAIGGTHRAKAGDIQVGIAAESGSYVQVT